MQIYCIITKLHFCFVKMIFAHTSVWAFYFGVAVGEIGN